MKKLINQRDAEGRPHGVWEGYYYSDGTLGWREHYHHGKEHGVWEDYYRNGILWLRAHYQHGVRRGLETVYDRQSRITDKTYHLVIR